MRISKFFCGTQVPATMELVSAEATSYAIWRRACDGVTEAYRSWVGAARTERWLAHAAYVAALDHEERAARAYQRLVEEARGTMPSGITEAHASEMSCVNESSRVRGE
jgi:hypothetical protein